MLRRATYSFDWHKCSLKGYPLLRTFVVRRCIATKGKLASSLEEKVVERKSARGKEEGPKKIAKKSVKDKALVIADDTVAGEQEIKPRGTTKLVEEAGISVELNAATVKKQRKSKKKLADAVVDEEITLSPSLDVLAEKSASAQLLVKSPRKRTSKAKKETESADLSLQPTSVAKAIVSEALPMKKKRASKTKKTDLSETEVVAQQEKQTVEQSFYKAENQENVSSSADLLPSKKTITKTSKKKTKPVYELPSPSIEQLRCIELIKAGKNVKVDSVAGSGKTTTILNVCNELVKEEIDSSVRKKRVLILTYNARLKMDCRTKLEKLGLDETVECHSYHAFCCSYYAPRTVTDLDIMRNVLETNCEPCIKNKYLFSKFDFVIIDEQQDMIPTYFYLVKKIMRELCVSDVQMMVLGDKNQTLYFFNRADPLFLELAHEIFPSQEREWVTANLSLSYRVPSDIALYINTYMLKQERILSVNKGGEIHRKRADFGDPRELNRVVDYFLERNYAPSDIFILAYSIRSKRVSTLSNYMSAAGKLIFVGNDTEGTLTEKILKNKIVFGSMHQTKGLERKVVIVLGFDDSYFKFGDRGADRSKCPNPLYVACTRALEHLVLLEDVSQDALSFLSSKMPEEKQTQVGCSSEQVPKIGVTDLLRGHDCEFLNQVEKKYLKVIDLNFSGSEKIIRLRGEMKVTTKSGVSYHEPVAHLYGMAATLSAEVMATAKCSLLSELVNARRAKFPHDINTKVLEELWFPVTKMKCTDFLHAANVLAGARGHEFWHQVRQIISYNWVEDEKFETLAKRIVEKTGCSQVETQFEVQSRCLVPCVEVIGFIDLVQPNRLWEIKCTQRLSVEDRLQLAIYAALHADRGKQLLLYNATDGQTQEIQVSDLDGLVNVIVSNKLAQTSRGMSVEQFWEAIAF